ncbi:MAG TPA: Gfo/Idh/MocA family oxidoreductase [Candidatus Limnocylindrales bacterium]|nr:Gfo/Idh/MocA family oxidoreductase [Candidatus Limnocylindrales bacterium]
MTRVAIVGMGTWGRQLIRVFDDLADVVLCCSRGDPAGVEWLRRSYPAIRAGSSAEVAFDDPSIEAVVIATPIPTHAPLAIAALAAGKHVFVEKPLATSGSEARRVVDAADASGRTLFVGHTFLYDAAFEALHGLVQRDPIETIELSWLKYGTFREPLAWNLLSHEVALAMWLVGRAPVLRIVERGSGQTATDRLVAELDFGAGGPAGRIEIDRAHREKVKTARIRTRSGQDYRWRDGSLERLPDRGAPERLVEHTEETLVREAAAFLEAVSSGRPSRSDGPFGAAVVDVIEPVAAALEVAIPTVAEPIR